MAYIKRSAGKSGQVLVAWREGGRERSGVCENKNRAEEFVAYAQLCERQGEPISKPSDYFRDHEALSPRAAAEIRAAAAEALAEQRGRIIDELLATLRAIPCANMAAPAGATSGEF